MSFEMLSFEMSFEMSAGRASVSVRTYTSHMNTVPSLLTCFRSRAAGTPSWSCAGLFVFPHNVARRIIEYLIDPNT